jgi:hypothetical protein
MVSRHSLVQIHVPFTANIREDLFRMLIMMSARHYEEFLDALVVALWRLPRL